MADKAGALALGAIHVDALAVNVVHEELAAISLWPTVAEIDHQAGVGMAAARRIGTAIAGMRAFDTRVMEVVSDRLDAVVKVGIERLARFRITMALVALGFFQIDAIVLATLAFIACALDHVPKMRNDAGLD